MLAALFLALPALAGEHPGFAKMKSLAGAWKGKTTDGGDVTVTYRVVSGGQAVEEQISHADMITMYHVDRGRLMLTHYCAAGNQPRMRAAPFKDGDKALKFTFVDATNLADKKAMHMHNVAFTFHDANHMRTEWVNYDAGKPAGTIAFNLERVK
jgi:hypothetical protein